MLFQSCSFKQEVDNKKLPNIVLILLNNVGIKDLNCINGNFSTPYLNKIIKESIVFSNAHSASSSGNPSMVSILTGKHPFKYNVYSDEHSDDYGNQYKKLLTPRNIYSFKSNFATLPNNLKSKGYTTCFVGKWGISNSPLDLGFDINIAGNAEPFVRSYYSPFNIQNLSDGKQNEHLTDRLSTEALNLITSTRTPFFLTLSYYSVSPPFNFTSNTQEHAYNELIKRLDKNIGNIYKTVSSDKTLRENTIFIITSVNGAINAISPQLPFRGGKGSYYDGGIRVPLFVKVPSKKAQNIKAPVSLLDIYPSIMEWSNANFTNMHCDGISLMHTLQRNESINSRSLFWHFPIYTPAYHPDKDNSKDPYFRTRPGSAIKKGDYKLIEYFEDGEIELYDIKNDAGEQFNIAQTEQSIANAYLKELSHWRAKHNALVPNKQNPNYKPVTLSDNSNTINSY